MRKNDVIIFLTVALVAVIIFICFLNTDTATTVTVSHNGEVIDILRLDQDTQKTYSFEAGSNTVCIKDGKVSVIDADCSGDCIACGKISKSGSSIICLPHGLIIKIEGGLDAVTK